MYEVLKGKGEMLNNKNVLLIKEKSMVKTCDIRLTIKQRKKR